MRYVANTQNLRKLADDPTTNPESARNTAPLSGSLADQLAVLQQQFTNLASDYIRAYNSSVEAGKNAWFESPADAKLRAQYLYLLPQRRAMAYARLFDAYKDIVSKNYESGIKKLQEARNALDETSRDAAEIDPNRFRASSWLPNHWGYYSEEDNEITQKLQSLQGNLRTFSHKLDALQEQDPRVAKVFLPLTSATRTLAFSNLINTDESYFSRKNFWRNMFGYNDKALSGGKIPIPEQLARWQEKARSGQNNASGVRYASEPPLFEPAQPGSPPSGPPQFDPPQFGPPQFDPPQFGPPQHGVSYYGPPQFGPPQYGPPPYGSFGGPPVL